MCKAYTSEEIKKMFFDEINRSIDFWEHVEGQTIRHKLEGLAFSILVMLDGCNANVPSFTIMVDPTNKEECIWMVKIG